ncbi:MAG: fibrinogen-like YCDxxxxGGGW domain-containing protein [Candidatus Absconditabacteria bacterium]
MAKTIKKFLKSFTLIELIIVIAIIAVLGVAAFLVLIQWMSKGRDAQRISDLSTIKTALDIALSKNDELPLPDEANELLYSGTEILYQGKFGDDVVTQIGTLNKVPKDRVNGEYEYSLLYDKKTYRIRAQIENDQYRMTFIDKVKASNNYYRYVGKDIKAVVVKEMFVYLPSMFISGYVLGEYDLYDNDFKVFEVDNVGEYKSGFAIHINEIEEIKAELGSLGLQDNEINQIIAQGTGQPQIVAQAKCNGTLPENAQLNGNQKNGLDLSYSETIGDCNYKCKSGYYFTGGNCENSQVASGNTIDGYEFFENGVQIYPQSCNDLLVSTEPNFKINGPWNGLKFEDGVYWIKPSEDAAIKVYCDMTNDEGGWTALISKMNIVYLGYCYGNATIINSFNNCSTSCDSNGYLVSTNCTRPNSYSTTVKLPINYTKVRVGYYGGINRPAYYIYVGGYMAVDTSINLTMIDNTSYSANSGYLSKPLGIYDLTGSEAVAGIYYHGLAKLGEVFYK